MSSLTEIELPSNKKFGILFIIIFSLLSLYLFMNGFHLWLWASVSVNIYFLITTLIKPELLTPLNRLWMKFGFLLSKIVSPLVISFIFFIIFTPVSILFKMTGRDVLEIKDNNKNSYWKIRSKSDTNYDQQF